MKARALAFLLLAGAILFPLRASEQELLIGYRHEAGVESKLLGTLLTDFRPNPRIRLDAGVAFSAIEHPGLARLELGMTARLADFWQTQVRAGIQHEQWNDWQVGENRALILLNACPLKRIELGLGMAYRAPVYSAVRYWLPYWFQSDAPELNLLYRLRWNFLERGRFSASAELANVSRLELHNPQQFPVELSGSWRIASGWSLVGRCGTASTGLSGLLISFPELTAEIGVKHGF